MDYNGVHSHSLGDKLSNFFSRFAHSCMIHFDNIKISHIACNTVLPLSAGGKTGDLAQVHITVSMGIVV